MILKNESAGSNSNYEAASWLLLPSPLPPTHMIPCVLGHPESTTAYAELQRNHHVPFQKCPLTLKVTPGRDGLQIRYFNLWHQPTFILKCSVFLLLSLFIASAGYAFTQLLGKGHLLDQKDILISISRNLHSVT